MSDDAAVKVVRADCNDLAHAQAIVDLVDVLAREKVSGGKQLAPHVRASLPLELSKRANITVLLASLGNEFVGCAVLNEGFSTFKCKPVLNIHDLVVAPHCRGRGIGSMLLEKIEEIAVQNDSAQITLEVITSNASAMDLYSRHGYRNAVSDPSLGAAHYWSKDLWQ